MTPDDFRALEARLTFPSGRVVELWHLDTYERRGDAWQAVWSQATPTPAACSDTVTTQPTQPTQRP